MRRSGHGYGILTRPTAGLSLSPCPSAQTTLMISATIQSADRADAAAIASLHAKSWRDAYRSILNPDFLAGPIEDDRLALWSNRLADPAPSLIVETARGPDHQLFGFIAVFRGHDPRWGSWVDNLHVTQKCGAKRLGNVCSAPWRKILPRKARIMDCTCGYLRLIKPGCGFTKGLAVKW